MKKNKSTKAKVRNLVRIAVILFLGMILSIIFCQKEMAAHDKIIESTVDDAFVFQSMLLAHHLEPNKPSSYTDIENLENDSESFVSDAAIKTGTSQYYIRVNYSANCVTIYSKDDDGNYTHPYKAMICSTGKATPKSGTYKITYKYRWLKLYGDVYGQYSTRIVKSILFHSVPYFEQSANTLEYDEYDKLGTTASAGCIRLTVKDAKWIYDNITSGTYVEFYSDPSTPGPLGKPKAQKISDNIECRDWDPTDPDINNPWNGGSGIPSVTYTTPKNTTKTQTSNKFQESNTTNDKTDINTSNNTTNTDTHTDKNSDDNKEPDNNEVDTETSKTDNSNTSYTDENTNTSNADDKTENPNTNSTNSTNTNTSNNTSSESNDSIKNDTSTNTETEAPEATKPTENTTNTSTTTDNT